jgi:hypothetical protein
MRTVLVGETGWEDYIWPHYVQVTHVAEDIRRQPKLNSSLFTCTAYEW